MKIILVAYGSTGDILPIVGFAKALQARGHEVAFLSNEHFRSLADNHGLPFRSIGPAESYKALTEALDIDHLMENMAAMVKNMAIDTMRPTVEAIQQEIVPVQTIVIGAQPLVGVRIAAAKFGLPMVTVNLAPFLYRSARRFPRMPFFTVPKWMPWFGHWYLYRLIDKGSDSMVQPAVDEYLAELGMPPIKRVCRWADSPDMLLGTFPEWFGERQSDWAKTTRLAEFPLFDANPEGSLSADVQAFLDAGAPPVVFYWGSGVKRVAPQFEIAVRVCSKLGRRAIFLTQFEDQLPPDLPPTIRYFKYVDFGRLLNQCSLLVHHGGVGTLAQAMGAGIPQVIVPGFADQFDNAERVKDLGVGVEIVRAGFDDETLTQALTQLDTPAVQAICRDLKSRIEADVPFEKACLAVEDLGAKRLTVTVR